MKRMHCALRVAVILVGIHGLPCIAEEPRINISTATETNWSGVALRDIEAAHRLISRVHPGVIEHDDDVFQEAFNRGYEQARALASKADSADRALAAVRFYISGYRDGHVAIEGAYANRATLWAGFDVRYQGGLYVVSKRAVEWPSPLPAAGSQVVKCDRKPVDRLLLDEFAPYVDRRFELDGTRSFLALSLTNDWALTPTWRGTAPMSCSVVSPKGERQTFTLVWRRSEEGLKRLHATSRSVTVQSFNGGTYWIDASNFAPDAQQRQRFEAALHQIRQLHEASAVVLDTRGNRGGSSLVGMRILNALLKQTAPPPITSGSYFRVSSEAIGHLKELAEAQTGQTEQDVLTRKLLDANLQKMIAAQARGDATAEFDGDSLDLASPEVGRPFRGRLVVLTDANCSSACLDFTELALRLPNAVHAGQPTSVDTRYTWVGDAVLPGGLRLWIPYKVETRRRGQSSKGLVPAFPYQANIDDTGDVRAWVERDVLPCAMPLSHR